MNYIPAYKYIIAIIICSFSKISLATDYDKLLIAKIIKPDGIGLYNAILSFQRACLSEPWSDNLAKRIVPEGFNIVKGDLYFFGRDLGRDDESIVISKTGDEQQDKAGGYAFISMLRPSAKAPKGHCELTWDSKFQSEGNKIPYDMMSLAINTFSQISFYLQAVPLSRPEWVFHDKSPSYSDHITWIVPCYAGFCKISTIWSYSDKSLNVVFSRRGPLEQE